MNKPLEIRGSLLGRNTLLNFIGQAAPLLVGVITIPFIVRGLGTDRFGLLSLAWVVLGYFTIFDLGLGRATTKFVAEALGKGEEDKLPQLVWTAVTTQALLGLAGALVLMGITPLLVERILNIPPALKGEAKAVFYLLALSLPVVLVSGSFSGVLEAAQRFDLVNAVRIPSSISTNLLTLVGVLLGLHLPGIVALNLVARFIALLVLVVLDFWLFPKLRGFSTSFALFPHLFSFGGWVMVSSIVGPILVYLDRFLIGSLLTLVAVAYYTAPYEIVTRLWIIPASLTMTLFPAFSTLQGSKDREMLDVLFARSIKYILLTLGPIILIVGLFAKDILRIWLGADFALESTVALQVLALGVLINSFAHTPFALLQGVGRPDLPAKFHLLELPIYVGIAWALVSYWGIAGAAIAWTFRVTLDALLLFTATFKVYKLSPCALSANGVGLAGLMFGILVGVGYAITSLTDSFQLLLQILFITPVFGLFGWFCWRYVMDVSDRRAIMKVVNLWNR